MKYKLIKDYQNKFLSTLERFTLKDEHNKPVYYIRGKSKFMKHCNILDFYDVNDKQVANVIEKGTLIYPVVNIFVEGKLVGKVTKKTLTLKQIFLIKEIGWTAIGGLGIGNLDEYTIIDNKGNLIASVNHNDFNDNAPYILNILNETDVLKVIAFDMAIETWHELSLKKGD